MNVKYIKPYEMLMDFSPDCVGLRMTGKVNELASKAALLALLIQPHPEVVIKKNDGFFIPLCFIQSDRS
ncbi:MAG: hypothetical protein LWW75_07955 [Chlorobiales bacterium]|nr:hypothetical protein [Chlorobiales bacterium]